MSVYSTKQPWELAFATTKLNSTIKHLNLNLDSKKLRVLMYMGGTQEINNANDRINRLHKMYQNALELELSKLKIWESVDFKEMKGYESPTLTGANGVVTKTISHEVVSDLSKLCESIEVVTIVKHARDPNKPEERKVKQRDASKSVVTLIRNSIKDIALQYVVKEKKYDALIKLINEFLDQLNSKEMKKAITHHFSTTAKTHYPTKVAELIAEVVGSFKDTEHVKHISSFHKKTQDYTDLTL